MSMINKYPIGPIMAINNNLPYRHTHRLPEYDYRQPGAYFITICTHNRETLFGEIIDKRMHLNAAGQMVQTVWDEIPLHFPHVILDEFVVMPDHFHGIVIINDAVGAIHELPGCFVHHQRAIHESPLHMYMINRRNMTIPKIIGRFKMQTAKQINTYRNSPGIPVWQRNYWEHIIRDQREHAAVCNYIHNNPANEQI
jgi:putative transposase